MCRLADAVIARTGDLEAAHAAHQIAAEALAVDPVATCAVLCSWLGVALNLGRLDPMLDIRRRALALVELFEPAQAIVATVDAAGLWVRGEKEPRVAES